MGRYFNKRGKPIKIRTWVTLMEDDDYRTIKKTHLKDVFISTVWLGLNHGMNDENLLIFETMVFSENERGALDQARYGHLDAAKYGHAEMVQKWEKEETE
ncbi:MAG: hypothetical protein ACPG5Z_00140 [Pseudoalteromonas sp.]